MRFFCLINVIAGFEKYFCRSKVENNSITLHNAPKRKTLSRPVMNSVACAPVNVSLLLNALCAIAELNINPAKQFPNTDPRFFVRVIIDETWVLKLSGTTEIIILLLGDW